MATKEISCGETTIKKKLHLNFKDLDKRYDEDGDMFFASDVPDATYMSNSYISSYHFEFYVSIVGNAQRDNSRNCVGLSCFGVKNLKCEFDLEILLTDSSKIKIVESCNMDCNMECETHIGMKKNFRIHAITGIMTLTFEVDDCVSLKDELVYRFGDLVLEQQQKTGPEKPEDIKIECQGEKIEFHKFLLSKVSDVFQNMVENPNFIESHQGIIAIKEISPDTIKTFKELLYENRIEKTDLDAELLIFCDRYNIKPMAEFCSEFLQTSVTKENLLEIVDAAYKVNDDELLKKAVDFVRLNYGSFEDIEQWEDFLKSNPGCVVKMMKFMMFKSNQ